MENLYLIIISKDLVIPVSQFLSIWAITVDLAVSLSLWEIYVRDKI